MTPPDLNESAARRLRSAIRQIRGAKRSAATARQWMGNEPDTYIAVHRLYEAEALLFELVRVLNDSERFAEPEPVKKRRSAA